MTFTSFNFGYYSLISTYLFFNDVSYSNLSDKEFKSESDSECILLSFLLETMNPCKAPLTSFLQELQQLMIFVPIFMEILSKPYARNLASSKLW